MSGVTAATVASYASIAAAAYSVYSAATADKPQAPDMSGLQPPKLSDATDNGMNAENERRKRVASSRNVINPTGGLGDTSTPSLSAKTLLGL